MLPANVENIQTRQQNARHLIINVESAKVGSDAHAPTPTHSGLEHAGETTPLLLPMEEKPERKLLPAWLKRKRNIVLLAGGAILLVVAVILGALGGTGKLTNKKEHHDQDHDGLDRIPEDGVSGAFSSYLVLLSHEIR